MKAIVWIDSWQMECCGEPFTTGSRVTWTVAEPDTDWLASVLGHDEAAAVTHAEEHHGNELTSVEGVVQRIRAVHYKSAPKAYGDPRHLYPVEGSATIRQVVSADGRYQVDDMDFGGYLVDLGEAREQTGQGPFDHGAGGRARRRGPG